MGDSDSPKRPPAETITSNGLTGTAGLVVCVPTYKDDATALVSRLAGLEGASRCALVIHDDGSGDDALTKRLRAAIMKFPGPARLVTSHENFGRSHARNRLVAQAEADWILLLDADMLPDADHFLTTYLDAIANTEQPALIAGGFTLRQVHPGAAQKLHYAQAAASDCLDAAARAAEPGRYVFTSNILVHRDVLAQVGFDEGFSGWGWEDVDWGLRVIEQFPIVHLDNTATHLGLEPDDVLVRKFGNSGANFARLVDKHPAAAEGMALKHAAQRLRKIPLLKPLARAVALQRFWPLKLRLVALKVYRASAYSEHLPARV